MTSRIFKDTQNISSNVFLLDLTEIKFSVNYYDTYSQLQGHGPIHSHLSSTALNYVKGKEA